MSHTVIHLENVNFSTGKIPGPSLTGIGALWPLSPSWCTGVLGIPHWLLVFSPFSFTHIDPEMERKENRNPVAHFPPHGLRGMIEGHPHLAKS